MEDNLNDQLTPDFDENDLTLSDLDDLTEDDLEGLDLDDAGKGDDDSSPYKKYGVDLTEFPEELRPQIEHKLKNVDKLVSKWGDEVKKEKQTIAAKQDKLEWLEGMERMLVEDPVQAKNVLMNIAGQLGASAPVQQKSEDIVSTPYGDIDLSFESDAVKTLVKMFATRQQTVDDLVAHTGAQKIQVEVDRLKGEFPDLDVNALIAEARLNPHVPLRYIAVNQSLPNLEKRVAKKVYENITKKKQAAPVKDSPASSTATPLTGKKVTFEEAAMAAMKAHGAKTMKG